LRVYMFGRVIYDDVFGGKWETDFCNAYFGPEGIDFPIQPPTNPPSTSFAYLGWQAKPCEEGNEVKERR
jgi:hypothetical protein